MIPASVRFNLLGKPSDIVADEISKTAGRKPVRPLGSSSWSVRFSGVGIIGMPEHFIPTDFFRWIDHHRELVDNVTMKIYNHTYPLTSRCGLYTIGAVRINLSTHNTLITGPSFEGCAQAYRQLQKCERPDRYDLDGKEFELEQELRRLQARNAELERENAQLRLSSTPYLSKGTTTQGSHQIEDRRDLWPG